MEIQAIKSLYGLATGTIQMNRMPLYRDWDMLIPQSIEGSIWLPAFHSFCCVIYTHPGEIWSFGHFLKGRQQLWTDHLTSSVFCPPGNYSSSWRGIGILIYVDMASTGRVIVSWSPWTYSILDAADKNPVAGAAQVRAQFCTMWLHEGQICHPRKACLSCQPLLSTVPTGKHFWDDPSYWCHATKITT